MLGAADEAVEIVGLPEGIQVAETSFVNQTAGDAFPSLKRVGEGLAVVQREEYVDVIRQDGIAPEVIALAIEVMKAVSDDLCGARITQSAGAVRGVEVFVDLVGELAVVAGFGDFVPRRWVGGEEGIAGEKPVIEEFTRQRIGEAESDEYRHLALLPMRQLVGRLFDVPSWIEELHDATHHEGSAGTLARFFGLAAKPRREEADRSVRAPLSMGLAYL